jgi:hypothetical protein
VRRRKAVLALTLAISVGSATVADARPVVHKSKQSPSEIARYWTPERKQNAKPAKRVAGQSPKAQPEAPPGPATSVEVPLPYPSAPGKVFFTDGGVNYVCSGTAVVSTNESVVWTAGHCLNEGPGDFFTNFLFVPAYRDGAAPYGSFAAPTLVTTAGWRKRGEFGVDLGAAVVATNESGQSLSDAVAEFPLVFGSARKQSYQVYGYPAAPPFNGQRLRVCNTAWLMNDTSTRPATIGVPCDMTGGSSGGGWVTASGAVASVVSYGYFNLKDVLFGPVHRTKAEQLYATAQAL